MKQLFILLAFFYVLSDTVYSQNYFEDTVWTRKTDQSAGFWMVKFSNTDSLIVGHGYDYDLFFDAKTGQEIRRIIGNNEIVFINNDRNFIRSNESRTRLEIFSTEIFQVIDTLENDSNIIIGSIVISKDEKYLVAPIPHGFRIWDVQLKKIVKTKIYEKPNEQYLTNYEVTYIQFLCDNRLIGQYVKTYQNPNFPYNQYQIGNVIVYDLNTLDSIDNYINSRGFRISNTCKYFASATGDPDYGIEIYEFNTKQLLWEIPINGPTLTGIEFSPDDKYLVTSSGPDANSLIVWDLDSGKEFHRFWPRSYDCIDVSHDGKFIIGSGARDLKLFYSRFGPSIVPGDSGIIPQIIYPNPTTGIATIQYQQPVSEITNIFIIGLNGQIVKPVFNNFLETGNKIIDFSTQDIPNGSYFVKVENAHLSLTFKLIVNK